MDIQQEKRQGVVIIAPVGRIDSTTSHSLEQALNQTFDAGDRRLVIDMADVEFISSAGLRVLLVIGKRLAGGQGRLVLCSLSESVHQVFDLAGFLTIFTLAPSRTQAIEGLASSV